MVGRSQSSHVQAGKTSLYTTIKARLYPTAEQAELFEKTFGCCRFIWNRMLSDQQKFYDETGAHFIPTPAKYKDGAPFLKEVDNQALIQTHNQLSQAFRIFFKNPEHFGHPRFKRKKDGRDAFTACNHVFSSGPTIYLTRDGIRMTKAGVVKAKFPRRPRNGWKLKRITVSKTRTGTYNCSIVFEYPAPAPQPIPPTPERTIGLKYSVSHFYVADNGAMADPPHWLKLTQEKLARLQQCMARMTPGSRNYEEAVQKYRLLHEHIANQRRDYIHKESRRIANAWDAVCVRADDLADGNRAMKLSNGLELGFGMFRACLDYKLSRQGKSLLMVERCAPTSRQCHSCGYLLPEGVDYRREQWRCPACGAALQREINAAQNIKTAGLRQVLTTQKSA